MAASKFDPVEAFAQLCASCRLPTVVQEKIKYLYETPLELHFAFQGKADVMEERREKLVLKFAAWMTLKLMRRIASRAAWQEELGDYFMKSTRRWNGSAHRP